MLPMKLLATIPCILLCAAISESFKILGIFHTPSKSHYIAGGALMKGLAEKGHDVTVVSPFPQSKPLTNFHDVPVFGVEKILYDTFPNITNMDDMGVLDKSTIILRMGILLTNFTLSHEDFQNFLDSNNDQYDVVVMEVFVNEAFLGLGYHFKAPIVGFSTIGASTWSNDMVGTPTPISYIPHFLAAFSNKMTFFERVMNFLIYTIESAIIKWYYMPQQEKIYNAIFPDPKPSLHELQKNVSLVLVNNHFTLNFPLPYVPNMIEVGGLQINRIQKKLPDDLQKILEEAEHGVIYFSLGSNVKSKQISVEMQKQILNVFRKLKQTVLWKWDEPLPEKLENVFVSHWYPQDDLLAHPNLKIFITHGGLLSITETIYHGVPIIGIPFFGDQHVNMAKAENDGYALTIPIQDLNEDTLFKSITEILTNDKYSKKIKLISERYRDQPLTPLETAIYWTEYVARHKGAPHLRSAGLDLSFFAYHSLDVFATLLGALYVVWRLIKWGCRKIRCRKPNKNQQISKNKKQK